MKICWFGFLARNHSWSFIGQNICRELIRQGHDVDMFSTNGIQYFPEDLKPNLKGYIEENELVTNNNYINLIGSKLSPHYDMQLSYTAMRNFCSYFTRGNKNRFGIWCYEWEHLPLGFAKNHICIDNILAPSNFAKDIFIKNGVPENKIKLIPHGINIKDYQNVEPFKLKTKKTRKIFVNIGQSHLRKNIASMFDAYGKAFTNKDDVCLVAKIHKKPSLAPFEVNAKNIYNNFIKKYPQHAEVELIEDFIPNIISLYVACDIVYTLSYCEGFYLPGLEAMACNKLNVCPRYGGQLDFLNDNNSLLVDGKMIRADSKMQYWEPNINNGVFDSNINDAATKLRKAVFEYESLVAQYSNDWKNIIINYTWEKVVKDIVSLCL